MSAFAGWFMRWVHSPTGPKTTHFWAPFANFFFPLQALYDWNRNPEIISRDMQLILVCYSSMFMRFAWQIKPRSYLLFTVHFSNFTLQGRLLAKRIAWEQANPELAEKQRQQLKEVKQAPSH